MYWQPVVLGRQHHQCRCIMQLGLDVLSHAKDDNTKAQKRRRLPSAAHNKLGSSEGLAGGMHACMPVEEESEQSSSWLTRTEAPEARVLLGGTPAFKGSFVTRRRRGGAALRCGSIL